MKPLLAAFVALLSCSASAQQAPVTRAEFATLFLPVAASFDIPEAQRKSLISFPLDEKAISKSEVALVLIAAAKFLGKEIVANSDPIARLRNAKFMPDNAAIFTDPGDHFRPADVVKALVAFVEGIISKPELKSTEEPILTRPTRGGKGGIIDKDRSCAGGSA